MTEKFIENLSKAKSLLQTADHMLYMTYPLVKEKRLLLKILNEIYSVMRNIVNAILQYEYFYKRIELYKDSRENFSVFKEKCASRYGITSGEVNKILEIFELAGKHKQSAFEFVRNDKVVIMTGAFHTDMITTENMKEYILLAKEILKKADEIIRNKK